MTRHYLLKNQPKIKIIVQAETNPVDTFQFVAFFAAFTGIFFFFSKLGHALIGG